MLIDSNDVILSFTMIGQEDLVDLLSKHPHVAGVSIALAAHGDVRALATGYARISTSESLTTDHYLQCASLSKTVATAFAIDYFDRKGIAMSARVNHLFEKTSCAWRIRTPPTANGKTSPSYSGDDITLAMLVNHTALGMHYVYGIPMSESMPSPLELLDGTCAGRGFDALYLLREPGKSFSYSGGGFIVLQLLIESMESDSIQNITRKFLDSCGLQDFTFQHEDLEGKAYAYGHLNREKEVQGDDGGRLMFAPFAAGAVCTPSALLRFLVNLAEAYHRPGCTIGGMSHHVASNMLGEANLVDLGAIEFMRGKVGLGVFVANAGPNRIMFHQVRLLSLLLILYVESDLTV
jgi:CubicO group peptidase (beta-lactamase class C family)